MRDMSNAVDPQTAAEWADEAAKQDEIAAQVESASSTPDPTPEPEQVIELPKVTLRPKADADLEFPIAVSVVGGPEEGLIFTGPEDTVEVERSVAEQITYSPAVEVAE